MGAEEKHRIWQAYNDLIRILQELKVELVPPTTQLEFIGIIFDSETMTMEISQDKMREIKEELDTWLLRSKARRKEVTSRKIAVHGQVCQDRKDLPQQTYLMDQNHGR